jgi:hypothetical protein
MKALTIDPKAEQAPTRDFPPHETLPEHNIRPSKSSGENTSLFFVGNRDNNFVSIFRCRAENQKDATNERVRNEKDSA